MNNDLEQFSEERLKEIIECSEINENSEMAALGRIALSAKQGKPVCYADQSDIERIKSGSTTRIGSYQTNVMSVALYTTPQPAHTEQDGWISIPKGMLADYRDVKNGEVQTYKASFGSHCDIPRSRWQLDLADLTEELAEIDKLLAAAPKPESE